MQGHGGLRSVAVIGLGLVGGSVARDLAALGVTVIGGDKHEDTLARACADGIVHVPLDASLAGVRAADVVVLAVPVDAAPRVLQAVASQLRSPALITDVGSTKRSIVTAAEALGLGEHFVGSHPLAGDHNAGWSASRPGLFSGARVYLCPAAGASPASLAAAESFWAALGGVPEVIDAALHDERLAVTSHLPQVLASALAHVLLDAGLSADDLGPGGLDVTRLAASPSPMWGAIALDNSDHLDGAIAALEARLARMRQAVVRRDSAAVRQFFDRAQSWRSAGV